jgi:hypothetical protein
LRLAVYCYKTGAHIPRTPIARVRPVTISAVTLTFFAAGRMIPGDMARGFVKNESTAVLAPIFFRVEHFPRTGTSPPQSLGLSSCLLYEVKPILLLSVRDYSLAPIV